jgi:hypothetical protein
MWFMGTVKHEPNLVLANRSPIPQDGRTGERTEVLTFTKNRADHVTLVNVSAKSQ